MPADNDFEKALRQKMEAFQLPPADADWQAVYKALHPPRSRRFPLWWWPLSALLLAGLGYGIWKWQGPAAMAGSVTSVNLDVPIPSRQSAISNGQVSAKESNDLVEQSETIKNSPIHRDPGNANQLSPAKNTTAPAKPNLANENHRPAPGHQTGNAEISASAAGDSNATTNAKLLTDAGLANGAGATVLAANTETTVTDVAVDTLNLASTMDYLPPAPASVIPVIPSAPAPIVSIPETAPVLEPSAASISVQKPQTGNSWSLGVWVSAGSTHPEQSFGPGMKSYAADYSGGITTGSGRSYTFTTNDYRNGFNLAGGVNIERTWRNRWKFIGGLGLGTSQWGQSGTVYKDSLLQTGAFFSRTSLETFDQTFSRLALQVPLTIHGKIGRGTHHSFWWNVGLQNQFLLSLKTSENRVNISQNFSQDAQKNNQTSRASFYQPAIVQGFMYQHAGTKYRYQIQPVLSLPLGNVYKASANNSIYPLEWQLQFRWLW